MICGRGRLAFLVVSQPVARRPEVGGGGARQAAGLPRAGREVEEEGEGSAPPSEALLRGRSQLSGAGAYITEEEN